MDVELEIVNRRGVLTRNTIEVAAGTTLTEMTKAAMQLVEICQWQRVRVGVGDMWSRWISAADNGGTPVGTVAAENGGAPVGTGAVGNGGAPVGTGAVGNGGAPAGTGAVGNGGAHRKEAAR